MAARTAVNPPTTEVVPVTLVLGEEEFLVDRAVRDIVAAVREAAPGGDVHDLGASELGPGELESLTSPSLFGGGCVLVVRSAQNAGKEVGAELVRYAGNPAPDVVLVLTHAGGAKGKELVAGAKAAGARMIECPKVTRFSERLDFIRAEFRRAGRRADDGAARALLDAVGSDLRELAAACDQLAADTDGLIDESVVARYYRGRAEATGFTVADRAVEGHLAQALEQLRWALATGVSPVLICSALAQGVRLLGRVGSAPRGASSAALAAATVADPLSAAPQQALLAMAVAAALLAISGFWVSIAANVRQRRAENALLAALGVSQRSAAAQLLLEKLLFSIPAAALGLLLGTVVARLLVPAVTLSPTAQLPVPPPVTLFDLPQTIPLAVAVAVLPALAAALVIFRRPDPAAQLRAAEAA